MSCEVRRLAIFDFDHTVADNNTDTYIRDLLPKELIPCATRKLYKSDGWTAYMQAVFKLLDVHGLGEEQILTRLYQIQPTAGMRELLQNLRDTENTDVIFISDSNDYFIEAWLKHYNLTDCVYKVFSNPARFANGLLNIEMYHLQTTCKLSTKNLCKGMIMEEFIANREKDENIVYDRVFYAGDGANDFCPMIRLRHGDLACVRKGFKCEELIRNTIEGRAVHLTGIIYELKANVLMWETGFDILHSINSTDSTN